MVAYAHNLEQDMQTAAELLGQGAHVVRFPVITIPEVELTVYMFAADETWSDGVKALLTDYLGDEGSYYDVDDIPDKSPVGEAAYFVPFNPKYDPARLVELMLSDLVVEEVTPSDQNGD